MPNTDLVKKKTSSPESDPEYKTKLMRRMKITKSNRFNYAKRLERKARSLSLSLNLLSLLTVLSGIYLLAYASGLTISGAQFVGTFSIGVSVFAIWFSRQGDVQEISKRATDGHRCGREISHIYRQLEAGTLDASKASEEYETVISSYDDNHDRCDFMSTLCAYKTELKVEKMEQGATWLNGTAASYFSIFSPILFAVLGTLLITVICLSTPMLNDYFKDVESPAATIGEKEQPLLESGTSQPISLPQEEPEN